MAKEIKSIKEFHKIADSQKAIAVTTISDIKKLVEDIKKRNKDYTIFSLIADEGKKYYICEWIKEVNNVGYYVLEGDYILKDNSLYE